jgi:hypothetical protein
MFISSLLFLSLKQQPYFLLWQIRLNNLGARPSRDPALDAWPNSYVNGVHVASDILTTRSSLGTENNVKSALLDTLPSVLSSVIDTEYENDSPTVDSPMLNFCHLWP